MFEALFRDGAEEVDTGRLPAGFEKYLRKALKELEEAFPDEKIWDSVNFWTGHLCSWSVQHSGFLSAAPVQWHWEII
ncbi:MAG: hypothetical protein ACLR6B_02320 [Blautia sp.]